MEKHTYKKVLTLILALVLFVITISACSAKNSNPIFIVEMKDNLGSFEIEMFPDKAPNTVNRVIDLAKKNYYDDLPVFSVLPNYMVKMGGDDKNTKGYAFPEETSQSIAGEFKDNGFDKNDIIFERGTVALFMQNVNEKDSAVSDFLIMLDREEKLDGKYAAFGKIIKGIEVVEAISNVKTQGPGTQYLPISSPRIAKTYLRLKGVDYPTPQTIKRELY